MQVARLLLIRYNIFMFFTVITVLFVVVFLIVSVPILLIELLVKKISPRAADYSQLRIVQWAFRVVEKLARTDVTVIGAERVPTDRAVLFVSNHQSYFDIVLTYSRMKDRTGFIAKKEVRKVPILATYMKRLYCLFIDRDDLRSGLQTILQAIEYVKSGISVYICPEGTRNKTDDDLALAPFHDASFKIAQRSGCPVVPIALNNTSDILERHFPKLKKTHVVLEYGEPVFLNDLEKEDRKHVGTYFRNEILKMLEKNLPLV